MDNSIVIKNNIKNFFRKINILVLIVFFSIIVSIIKPNFLSINNLSMISFQMVPLGLIALGQTFVLITGGIDLSTGFGISLSSITLGIVFGLTNNIFISLATGITIVLIISLINSYFIIKVKLSPVITTIATMSAAGGIVMIITSIGLYGRVIYLKHEFLSILGRGTFFNIPYSLILLILLYVLAYIFFNYHRFGNYIIAIGDDENTARLSGVNIAKYKFLVYLISGCCSALAGIIMSSRMSLVQPIITGAFTLLINSIVAVVLGGTSISGGKGNIQGTFLGLILISLIDNALIIINIAANYKDAFRGGIIIILLILNQVINRDKQE